MAITKVKGSVDGSVLDNIEALLSASQSGQYTTLGYHTAGDGGGGEFYWDSSQDKANHNGGTIIDPDVTFPSDWTNQTQVTNWFTATGVTTGCWVRVFNDEVYAKWFGAKGDNSQDSTIALQQSIDLANANGYRLHINSGTYLFSNLTIPSGRGLIIEGAGQNKTILKHTGTAKGIELGADGIQRLVLQNLTIQPSANTTSLLAFDGDYSAYGFEFYNLELNEGASGNNTVTMLKIGGGTTLSHQKHYFSGCGIKIFGGGIGVHIDGVNVSSAGLSNDHRFWGIQIQSCAHDGLLLEDTFNNDFVTSIESCGDGVTWFCYRLTGIADDNRVYGRLEFTGTSNEVYRNSGSGNNNRFMGSLSATPANPNDLATGGGHIGFNGLVFENLEHRNKGLYRPIPASTSTYFLRSALPTDTMGGYGRFGIRADGHMGWAAATNPSRFDANLDWDSGNGHLRFVDGGGAAFKGVRMPKLVLDDGVTPQGALTGMAQIYVDAADGDLKIKFGDGVIKTIMTDS